MAPDILLKQAERYMSKKSLEKELARFDAAQLRAIILNAYSSSDEAKEYFEFFVNPDVDKLFEKCAGVIHKEFTRSKWGMSKGRISLIRKQIKKFRNFDPGAEHVLRFMFHVVAYAAAVETMVDFNATLRNGIFGIVYEGFKYAAENGMMSTAYNLYKSLITSEKQSITRYFKEQVQVAYSAFVKDYPTVELLQTVKSK